MLNMFCNGPCHKIELKVSVAVNTCSPHGNGLSAMRNI